MSTHIVKFTPVEKSQYSAVHMYRIDRLIALSFRLIATKYKRQTLSIIQKTPLDYYASDNSRPVVLCSRLVVESRPVSLTLFYLGKIGDETDVWVSRMFDKQSLVYSYSCNVHVVTERRRSILEEPLWMRAVKCSSRYEVASPDTSSDTQVVYNDPRMRWDSILPNRRTRFGN